MQTGLKILLTNDDGIHSAGMFTLVSLLQKWSNVQLYIVAPATQQSGASMSFSSFREVAIEPYDYPKPVEQAWAVHGTPIDCVKLALRILFTENPPDLVISGINHGENTGRNLFYSGTVGAAHEALLYGIPAIALSQCTDISLFQTEGAEKLLHILCSYILGLTLPWPIGLNINFPGSPERIPWKGMRLVPSGDEFIYGVPQLVRQEGNRQFYSLHHSHAYIPSTPSEEFRALQDLYISVAPLFVKNSPVGLLTPEEFAYMQHTFHQFVTLF